MTGVKVHKGQAGLPSADSTHSIWHREPSETLLGHRTTAGLPHDADVVVIGSGITGAFASRELVGAGRSVLMLEAREACWGATGRNGGHCQPGVWNNTPTVARFELATFDMLNRLVVDNDIPCEWQTVGGVHPLLTEAELGAARRQMRRLEKCPDLRDKAVLMLDEAELAEHRVPNALGAVYQPVAAKLWPYKLVAWVLEQLLAAKGRRRFNLQTGTPALHLQRAGPRWIVHTERGQVAARHVVLAANAYTSFLMPRMTGLVVPVRGQVCALRPPDGAVPLPHSYVWLAAASDDYLIQRGPDDRGGGGRELVVGGERFAVADGQEGISRDDEADPIIGHRLRRALASAVKLRLGEAGEEPRLEAEYEWTGIMGYSRDTYPWVGRVPARLVGDHPGDNGVDGLGADGYADGLWISAGYTGHGMPVAARCGVAVANMILAHEGGGGDAVDEAATVPPEFLVTEERAAAARLMTLPRTLVERLSMLDAIVEAVAVVSDVTWTQSAREGE